MALRPNTKSNLDGNSSTSDTKQIDKTCQLCQDETSLKQGFSILKDPPSLEFHPKNSWATIPRTTNPRTTNPRTLNSLKTISGFGILNPL